MLSWNVQGLGGALCRRFKARIRRELHKFQVGSCDLIMLQEHHLDASKIQSYGNMLRGDWRYYWIPACGQLENKCGVCMILSDKWMQFVLHSQQVVEGRAHYLLLKINDVVWGFLNIYAPNDRGARKGFWTQIVQQLPC